MSRDVEIQLVLAVTAVACALPGVFLVLRRMALLSDAISHSLLLGIVLAFFLTGSLTSPLLVLGAALVGVLTVVLVEVLNRTRLVHEDAAIGLVFPCLFSIGVILISLLPKTAHVDVQCVLLGKPELAPLNRLKIGGTQPADDQHAHHGHDHDSAGATDGTDLGPKALYVMGVILLLNLAYVTVFYKELKLATFDPALAVALGFAPGLLHYGLMLLVSVTAVGAFETAGSILVVALMIGPAATAYLLTDRLGWMLWLSAGIGIFSGISGYWLAVKLDASIAGAMTTMLGLVFLVVHLLAPERGLIALLLLRRRQRWEFAQTMLAIHLFHHEGLPEAERESRIEHLQEGLNWNADFATQVVQQAERSGLVTRSDGHLQLTEPGRTAARQALVV